MKTIKIFLASSEELENDRMAFGNLVRRLDKIYEKRGIRIELFEWEDFDAAFNGQRKQDEYNENVRNSDMFLAMFHRKAGKFTIEEFNVATEEFKKHASPKVYTYCKDLQPGEEESPELVEFKKRLFDEMGHYWCRYDNKDSMQLHFVMQLQLVENSQSDALKVENGSITLDGMRIADMDNLKFAAANKEYLDKQNDIHELHDEIEEMQLSLEKKQEKLEKKKAKLEKDPDDKDYQEEYQEAKEEADELVDKLQPKLNKYNKLKEEFAEHQNLLFNTAKRVAQLQGERITERMRRAMDAFNEGKVREANIILDEAEADARRNLEDYKQSKEITEMKRQAVISSIDELLLKTSTIMADATIPIEERKERTENVYAQADEMARETEYDKEKYVKLLFNYADFLFNYARYNHAKEIYERLMVMLEKLYGTRHLDTVIYNNLGLVYHYMGDYSKALEYYLKALEIREKVLGKENPSTALSYNNIGGFYYNMGDYPKALEYYSKALEIREIVLGKKHPSTAISYNNIGGVYDDMGEYPKALEYYLKALKIREEVHGKEHPETAGSYNNIGSVYSNMGDYLKALEYSLNAMKILEKTLGKEHPQTALSYNNIGLTFRHIGDNVRALEYSLKALEIQEKVLGKEHPDTALSYNNIGSVYYSMGEYQKTLECYLKALEINEIVLGKEHPDTALSYNNIGSVYYSISDYSKALEYYSKALEIREIVLGKKHPSSAISYDNIGSVYSSMGDYPKALEYLLKALEIRETVLGIEHPSTVTAYNNIGLTYRQMGDNVHALEYRLKALEIEKKVWGEEHISTARSYNNIGAVYRDLKQYDKAIEYITKAYEIAEKLGDNLAKATYLNRLGRTYAAMGDIEEARAKFQAAIDLLPEDHPEAIDSRERMNNLN